MVDVPPEHQLEIFLERGSHRYRFDVLVGVDQMQRNHIYFRVGEYAGHIVDGLLLLFILLTRNNHLGNSSGVGKAGLHSIVQFQPFRCLGSISLTPNKSRINKTSLDFLFSSVALNFGDVHRSVGISIADGCHGHLML